MHLSSVSRGRQGMMMARGEDVAGVDVAVEDLVRADLVGKDAYSGSFSLMI